MSSILVTAIAGGIGSAMGGCIVWFFVKRPFRDQEKTMDTLKHEVRDLRDDEIKDLKAADAKAESSRKSIHQELDQVRRKFVHKEECAESRRTIADQVAGFQASVLKLERVSERTDMALERGEELMRQTIAVKEDVAGLVARVEAISGRQ